MVIDSSALLAILLNEAEASDFLHLIKNATFRQISAASFLETGMVLHRDATGGRLKIFEELVAELQIAITPVTEQLARSALDAFSQFGKGSGHRAGLNFGDCLVYALAKTSNEPLLFKGNDFNHTDIPKSV